MLTLKSLDLARWMGSGFREHSRPRNAGIKDGSDRRIFPRVKNYNLIRYTFADGGENDWISNLKDISEGGVQFNSPVALRRDMVMRVKINLMEANRQIEVVAKTMWTCCQQVRGSLVHRVGAAFLEIQDRDKMLLRDFALCNG